jgi:hypothetical protein
MGLRGVEEDDEFERVVLMLVFNFTVSFSSF